MLQSLAAVVTTTLPAAALVAKPPPVAVMVLGTFFPTSLGRDFINAKVDDVLTPRKQTKPQTVTDRLVAFKPTKIVIGRGESSDLRVAGYDSLTPATLRSSSDEEAQIGYRPAAMLGHRAVYGFDEQPPAGPAISPSTMCRAMQSQTARQVGCRGRSPASRPNKAVRGSAKDAADTRDDRARMIRASSRLSIGPAI